MGASKSTIKIDSDEEISYQSIPDQEDKILIIYKMENEPKQETIVEIFTDDDVLIIEESLTRLREQPHASAIGS